MKDQLAAPLVAPSPKPSAFFAFNWTNLRSTTKIGLADASIGNARKRRAGSWSAPLKRFLCGAAALAALTCHAEAAWVGKASYYSGRRAASGAFTAAHRTLPFGSQVRVTNLKNNRSVVVTINDRGPFTHGRLIDVSTGAADALGFRSAGIAQVMIEPVAVAQR